MSCTEPRSAQTLAGRHAAGSSVASRAYFRATAQPDVFVPLRTGFVGWNAEQLQGPAITGLLTRGALQALPESGTQLQLVRASYDLFAVSRMVPTRVRTEIVRRGRRVTLIDAFLEQDGRDVSRAQLFFAPASESPENVLWASELAIVAPEPEESCDRQGRRYFSDQTGWTDEPAAIPGAAHKALWQQGVELVEGETISGFLLAGFAADVASATVNWGTHGVRHINMEATMTLVRAPSGGGIGLLATQALEYAGISAGSVVLFDEEGPLGVATVSSIVHENVVWPGDWA